MHGNTTLCSITATVIHPVTKIAVYENCAFILYYQEQSGETASSGLLERMYTVFQIRTTTWGKAKGYSSGKSFNCFQKKKKSLFVLNMHLWFAHGWTKTNKKSSWNLSRPVRRGEFLYSLLSQCTIATTVIYPVTKSDLGMWMVKIDHF